MADTVTKCSPISNLRSLRKLLMATICIMVATITLGLHVMFSESGRSDSPNYTTNHFPQSSEISVEKTASDSNMTDNVFRPLVTKSEYPTTVSAPFVIENPNICHGKVTLLIVVKSSPNHLYKRSLIRQSFGNVDLFTSKYNVRLVFTLGLTNYNDTKETLTIENSLYHDIVQGEFMDTYKNLTLKGVMAYRWISLHCSHAELILTMDDDIFVNVFNVFQNYLTLFAGRKKFIMCNIMKANSIIRGKSRHLISRWSVDDDFFRGEKYFPPYCSGFSIFMSADVPRALWKAAHFTPFFWVDDVYLTGLLPSKYRMSLRPLNERVSLNFTSCKLEFKRRKPRLVSCTAEYDTEFQYLWARSLHTMLPSMRRLVNQTFLNETLEERNKKLDWLHYWM